VLAEVLACVPRHGLEAVLVAAELILESGNTSAEHVKNVLSRLKEPGAPTMIQTALRVAEPPIADAGRYDRLRKEADHA
jgi:hypothetical protein